MALSRMKLFVTQILDRYVRENFMEIDRYMADLVFTRGDYKFMQLVAGKSGTHTFYHGLGFTPKDIMLLSVRNDDAASVTFHYDDFNKDTISVTTDAGCTIRIYLGNHRS